METCKNLKCDECGQLVKDKPISHHIADEQWVSIEDAMGVAHNYCGARCAHKQGWVEAEHGDWMMDAAECAHCGSGIHLSMPTTFRVIDDENVCLDCVDTVEDNYED